jgi:hypothetical protein
MMSKVDDEYAAHCRNRSPHTVRPWGANTVFCLTGAPRTRTLVADHTCGGDAKLSQ